jgi:hypothetical protein
MKNFSVTLVVISAISMCLSPSMLLAQDSTSVVASPSYTSFGFQWSWGLGSGLSFGKVFSNNTRVRLIGGVISTEDQTDFSVGADVHYILANTSNFVIFIGPSFGVAGSSKEKPKNRIALATALESPITGDVLPRNISGGVVLYYPTYYFVSKTINPVVGFYILYNF